MMVDFVADVSSNHARDLERSLAFVDMAAAVRCHAVKFQLFRVKQLFAPAALARSEALRKREAWELPLAFLPHLASRAHEKGIGFGCTPFDLDGVGDLLPYVDFYKISSYELLWSDLLRACGHTGKPVVLATGMATLDEVRRATETLRASGCEDLTILHCISGYPTPVEECNLAAIDTLRETCGCPIGWSDHSVNPAVILRAIYHWGARMVEFHMDLDGEGAEFGAGHCWLPEQIRPVIETVRLGVAADGPGVKTPSPSELADRDWRADPSDGLRPLLKTREAWRQ